MEQWSLETTAAPTTPMGLRPPSQVGELPPLSAWVARDMLMRGSGQLETTRKKGWGDEAAPAPAHSHSHSHSHATRSALRLPRWSACAWCGLCLAHSPPGWGSKPRQLCGLNSIAGWWPEASRSLGLWEENNREGPSQEIQGQASSGSRKTIWAAQPSRPLLFIGTCV